MTELPKDPDTSIWIVSSIALTLEVSPQEQRLEIWNELSNKEQGQVLHTEPPSRNIFGYLKVGFPLLNLIFCK